MNKQDNMMPQDGKGDAQKHQGGVSDAQIEGWKKQYGGIFKMTVGDKVGYMRKPDRKVLAYASSGGTNRIKVSETVLRSIWLGGDEEILENDEYFLGAIQKLDQMLKVREAELEKL